MEVPLVREHQYTNIGSRHTDGLREKSLTLALVRDATFDHVFIGKNPSTLGISNSA